MERIEKARENRPVLLGRCYTPPGEETEFHELRSDLAAFCNDWARSIERFAVRQSLRHSREGLINQLGLENDMRTERTGNPHVLVCKKNRHSFKRQLNEYRADIAAAPPGADEGTVKALRKSVSLENQAPKSAMG